MNTKVEKYVLYFLVAMFSLGELAQILRSFDQPTAAILNLVLTGMILFFLVELYRMLRSGVQDISFLYFFVTYIFTVWVVNGVISFVINENQDLIKKFIALTIIYLFYFTITSKIKNLLKATETGNDQA